MEEKPLKTSLKSILLRGCISASLALGALSLMPPTPVSAAMIMVTETDDHLHSGSVGTCNSGVDCTLREAVALANESALTEDTITFAAGLSGATITLNEYIAINSPITISGTGVGITIAGDGDDHLFTVGGTLSLEDLTLAGGRSDSHGGAIINQNGTVNLTRTIFNNNRAADFTIGTGGAIYNHGLLTINRSVFTSNTANAINGGGAIYTDTGSVSITDSTFSTNYGSTGGAIAVQGGSVTLTGSTIESNVATLSGAGIQLAAGASASINNSTLAGNYVTMGTGGAIYSLGTVVANFTTIADNDVSTGTGAGIYAPASGSLTMTNSIIAGNDGSGGRSNCDASFDSSSTNMADDATCGSGFTYSAAIGLQSLGNYGGYTQTIPISDASSAINAAASCIATDQRGMNRGATCDNGAYEYDGQPGLTINDVTVTEGNSGTTTAAFTVTLSAPAPAGGVTFDIASADNSATTADGDYVTQSLTGQTIAAGSSTYTFNVTVNGDTAVESDETFFVNITNVTGAIVSDGQGAGTIRNDDVVASADLAVTLADSPDPVIGGGNLSYTIGYANNGPSAGDSVSITSTLASGTTFVSLTPLPGWSCTTPTVGSSGTVTCSIASLASGTSGTTSLVVNTSDALINGSTLSQTTTVISSTTDSNPGNNAATATTSVHSRPLAVTGSADSVTYNSATLNGQVNPLGVAASVTFDYGLTIAYGSSVTATDPGTGTAPVSVTANLSGLSPETTYHYRVVASNSNGASYGDDATFTTDPASSITINDVSQAEGNSGTTTFTFSIALNKISPTDASFDITTADGTASTADNDYAALNLTSLTIPAGELSTSQSITVNGDQQVEGDETFMVNLSNPVGAVFSDSQAVGTITNDDTAGVTVNPTSGLTTTEAGGTATFTVVLNTQPISDVTIGLTSSDTTEGTVSPASLTFAPANWNVPQTATATGVDDALADGDIAYTIQTGDAASSDTNYSGVDPADVSVTNQDDDSASVSLTTVIHNGSHATVTTAAEGDLLHANATATGNGALTPTDDVTFEYFNNVTCTGTAAGSDTVALDASGVAEMTTPTALTADGLSFIAHYGGDPNYPAEDGACVSISTSASPTVLITSVHTIPAHFANLPTGISTIQLQFNRDVMHDSNGNPDSVTNPANYLLVERGPNGILDTLSCLEGVAGDDRQYTVNTVSYDPATYRATVHINNGVQLTDGIYRLYVSGTTSIRSADGSAYLNGHSSDSTIIFIVGTGISSGGSSSSKKSVATGFTPGMTTVLPEQPAELAYSESELWIEIPALGIEQQIVGVPQTNAGWDVSWLGNEIGYLQGTAFPTWAGNSVLTGHVTGADGLPGVFADLGTLQWGDEVIIHAFGQKYVYEVRTVDLSTSPDTSKVMNQHEDLPWLTLITCRGYDEKTGVYRYRTIVRAVQVSVEEE